MLKVNIVCVGNIKDKFFDEAQKEYLKRLSKYCTVTVKELKEYNNLENIGQIKTQECENILQNVKGYFILLDIKGTKMSSEELSKKLSTLTLQTNEITFVIGGSYGVTDELKQKANLKISFSDMTFPHRLFRVMLLEQIYRAFCIANNTPYHK